MAAKVNEVKPRLFQRPRNCFSQALSFNSQLHKIFMALSISISDQHGRRIPVNFYQSLESWGFRRGGFRTSSPKLKFSREFCVILLRFFSPLSQENSMRGTTDSGRETNFVIAKSWGLRYSLEFSVDTLSMDSFENLAKPSLLICVAWVIKVVFFFFLIVRFFHVWLQKDFFGIAEEFFQPLFFCRDSLEIL